MKEINKLSDFLMTVLFSKKCEIGLQAVLYLSTEQEGDLFNSFQVSERVKQPKEFVSKVLQILTASGIVGSKKGKNGGFFLAKPASTIKLIEIVEAIDGISVFEKCVLGFPDCGDAHPCPVHSTWGKIRDEAYNMLMNETLQDFKSKTFDKLATL
ncbi:MAG: Rrf2 family transcriptional regulator [Melioribacteraceae bacterium]|jgi:Rrf2 family iron-sulfur cluster assembly transcriptional regulator|nr:Rrf2 family transcriptional regulator [Melioribacteraceae bacterium]